MKRGCFFSRILLLTPAAVAKLLLLCLVSIFLGSCTPANFPHLTPQQQALCQIDCQTKLQFCQKTCRNNCSLCRTYANQQAQNRYNRYVHEQQLRAGLKIRRLNSYRDPLQCRKITCDCMLDYKICRQSCRGRIDTRLRPPPVY